MTSDQALAAFIMLIMVICLTIDSALLVRDCHLPAKDDEPWQRWIGVRVVTLLILWGTWALFTISFIPWGDPAKKAVKDAVVAVEDATAVAEDAAQSAVGL